MDFLPPKKFQENLIIFDPTIVCIPTSESGQDLMESHGVYTSALGYTYPFRILSHFVYYLLVQGFS